MRKWSALSGAVLGTVLEATAPVFGQEMHPHSMNQQLTETVRAEEPLRCTRDEEPFTPGFEGVQVETSDLALYEQFFGVIPATLVRQLDHPQRDRLREYCYRGVTIVVRQDLTATRPTGWVQLNFSVPDAVVIKREVERAYEVSPVFKLEESERTKIIRFRLKPDVMRGRCRAVRFEVAGPEGFMIGFDQFKREQCREAETLPHGNPAAAHSP